LTWKDVSKNNLFYVEWDVKSELNQSIDTFSAVVAAATITTTNKHLTFNTIHYVVSIWKTISHLRSTQKTRMWANAQRDGRPAEYRWRRVLNAAKFGSRPLLQCRAVKLPI